MTRTDSTPRYLRFAQSLALATAVVGLSGCPTSQPREVCSTCRCEMIPTDAAADERPLCATVEGAGACCAVIGPLAPPDLPA